MRPRNSGGMHSYLHRHKTIYDADTVLLTPLKIFYSYAQADSSRQVQLEQHLSALGHRGLISSGHSHAAQPGTNWRQTNEEHIDTADIILLLISPDFMSSQDCYGVEMQHALERHNDNKAYVIAVIVRPVQWAGTPIEQLPILPAHGKPITTWRPQDEGFRVTADEISQIVKDLLTQKLETAGRVLYLARHYQEAEKTFNRLLLLDPKNVTALNGLGFITFYDREYFPFLSPKRHYTAEGCFHEVLAYDPTNASAKYGLGCVLLEAKHYEQALLTFDDVLKTNPGNVDYYISKSLTLLYLNLLEEALSTCERSLQLDPDNATALHTMGNILDALNRYEEARDTYNKALDAYNKAFHLNSDTGVRRDRDVSYQERLLLDSWPSNASCYYACKGNILSRLSRYEEALEAYNEAIAVTQFTIDYHMDRSYILQELERYEEALEDCELVLHIDRDNVDATFLKVTILIKLERSKEALATLNQISSRVPHDASFYRMQGHAFLALGAYDEALVAWDGVIRLDPDNAAAYEGKGNVFDKAGRYDEALNSYNEALRLDPSKTSIHKNKGDTLCRLRRYDEALAAYDDALRLDPNDAVAHSTKGLILNTLKRAREALTSLDEALRLDPNNPNVRRLRDSVHRDLVNSGQIP